MDLEKKIQKNETKNVLEIISEIERKVAELEGQVPEQQMEIIREELNVIKTRKQRFK